MADHIREMGDEGDWILEKYSETALLCFGCNLEWMLQITVENLWIVLDSDSMLDADSMLNSDSLLDSDNIWLR